VPRSPVSGRSVARGTQKTGPDTARLCAQSPPARPRSRRPISSGVTSFRSWRDRVRFVRNLSAGFVLAARMGRFHHRKARFWRRYAGCQYATLTLQSDFHAEQRFPVRAAAAFILGRLRSAAPRCASRKSEQGCLRGRASSEAHYEMSRGWSSAGKAGKDSKRRLRYRVGEDHAPDALRLPWHSFDKGIPVRLGYRATSGRCRHERNASSSICRRHDPPNDRQTACLRRDKGGNACSPRITDCSRRPEMSCVNSIPTERKESRLRRQHRLPYLAASLATFAARVPKTFLENVAVTQVARWKTARVGAAAAMSNGPLSGSQLT